MKSTITLKNAEIFVNGELKETVELKNPCQMYKALAGWKELGEGVRVIVHAADGSVFKDYTYKALKNGKAYLMNSVHETNRWMTMKANGKVTLKGKERIALKAETEAEKQARKEAEKKAKKAAYDKARRERLKAEKAANKAA